MAKLLLGVASFGSESRRVVLALLLVLEVGF
jgi:hypothetical protein